jgi:hypothetical protein
LDACVVGHGGAVFGHFAEGASSVSVVGRHVYSYLFHEGVLVIDIFKL